MKYGFDPSAMRSEADIRKFLATLTKDEKLFLLNHVNLSEYIRGLNNEQWSLVYKVLKSEGVVDGKIDNTERSTIDHRRAFLLAILFIASLILAILIIEHK